MDRICAHTIFSSSVKWAEYMLNSICIRMLHQIIFVTLTQLNIYIIERLQLPINP